MMISYSDQTEYTKGPSAWREAHRRLGDELHKIGQEFGDDIHTSGPVDYLVRFLVSPKETTVREKIRNYLLVIVTEDGVETITKIDDGEPSRGGRLTFEESWVEGIRDQFRSFRERLE